VIERARIGFGLDDDGAEGCRQRQREAADDDDG
jgi:hypothetical protein